MSQHTKDERELLSGPGESILETLEHLKMNQADLAERIGKTPSKVNDIISSKEPITMSTALLLEKVLGIDARFWINREALYREKLARIEQEEQLESCIDWLKLQPYKQLIDCGYIQSVKPGAAMVDELLTFYGIGSLKQFDTIYLNKYASAQFRKSDAHQTALGSIAAWLRIGEIERQKMKLPEFNKDSFKSALFDIRSLVRKHPENFAERLRDICFKAGVAVVYTACLPKAPVSGAVRWVGGNPLLQLTDRNKTNDHFWFAFFHEAGHIMLHGKKEVFIESFEGYECDKEKESEADAYAANQLLTGTFINDLPKEKITAEDIRKIARTYETHPAIVLGRLRRMGKVAYHFGTDLLVKINLDEYTVTKKNGDM
jgi:HTH-type transcriptional regulator/antitoxin HigA